METQNSIRKVWNCWTCVRSITLHTTMGYTTLTKNPAIHTGFLRKQTTKWKLRLSRER